MACPSVYVQSNSSVYSEAPVYHEIKFLYSIAPPSMTACNKTGIIVALPSPIDGLSEMKYYPW